MMMALAGLDDKDVMGLKTKRGFQKEESPHI